MNEKGYSECDINSYFRLVNENFHDLALAYAFIKGGCLDDIVLYKNDGVVVAGTFLVPKGDNIHQIEYFCVNKEQQCKSNGTKLLLLVEEMYKGLLIAETRKARDFYLKRGFVSLGVYNDKDMMVKYNE